MTRLATLSAVLFLSSCAHVASYQRSELMTPQMEVTAGPLETSLDAHLFQTRESMLGATVSGGASCGCN